MHSNKKHDKELLLWLVKIFHADPVFAFNVSLMFWSYLFWQGKKQKLNSFTIFDSTWTESWSSWLGDPKEFNSSYNGCGQFDVNTFPICRNKKWGSWGILSLVWSFSICCLCLSSYPLLWQTPFNFLYFVHSDTYLWNLHFFFLSDSSLFLWIWSHRDVESCSTYCFILGN